MACGCKKGKRQRFIVKLPGGLKVEKTSQAAATAFAARHPGATVIKPAAS